MNTELRHALEQVARRIRHARLLTALALCWLAWAFVGGLFVWSVRSGGVTAPSGGLLAGFLGAAVATGLVCALVALRSARDRRWVARRIEAKHPDLGTGLLAAVEADDAAAGRLGFLQSAVVREAVVHGRLHDWDQTVPNWAFRGTKLAHAAALAALIVVAFALAGQARSRQADGLANGIPGAAAGVTVEPGDAEIERGTSLLVVARFAGVVPAEANLVIEDGEAAGSSRSMTRSLEDPAFAGRVESVETDLTYRVEYDGRSSETYRVTVFEYPEVLRADARLVFPEYTSLAPKTVEDIRHVTAVEGTGLTLLCRLNKTVATARLVDERGRVIELTPGGDGEPVYTATFKLTEPLRLRAEVEDAEGRSNQSSFEITVNAIPNKPPVVAATQPARDVRVSPLEELTLAAKLEDDFGVTRHGVSYMVAGKEPREIVLSEAEGDGKRFEAKHLLAFESFGVEPDQLVTYHFWAEDIGPDGTTRRTLGDMYFAEVRPFEEIFRQGEQPPGGSQQSGGQQGTAQDAMRLAELQKEIINGTWAVFRRETGPAVSDKFRADMELLHESERSAIEQAGQLGQRLQDPESRSHLAEATELLNDAATHLAEAMESADVASLTPALAAEQAAYQALLKLRDREFNVVRSSQQRQGGGGSAGGPSQQQLRQLELSNDENRYEERRSARPEDQSREEQQQREDRQVLNRLRELARRQEDLNERLKEMQSALEAAEDEQAREEIERQLKRLREQQQEILRDADELRERMEREENRDRMAEARQQAEQNREHIRQASEALEEGRLSQALTEGTRASRGLNDLREEFRKQTSSRFAEEMTEMRDEARRLDETQDRLSEQLEEMERSSQRSLRDEGERGEVKTALEQQREQTDRLLERMRETVQEAEQTEPLLAEELFETVREADRQSIPDALEAAERLTDLGVPGEAAKASRHAGEGLDRLREGVERAAESVLGDETEALRRAADELDDLAEQVDREIARSTGTEPGESSDAASEDATREGDEPGQRSQDQAESEQGSGEESRQPSRQGTERGNEENRPSGEGGRESSEGDRQSRQEGQERQGGSGGQPQSNQPQNGEPSQGGSSETPQEGNRQGRSLRGGSESESATTRSGAASDRPSGLDRLLDNRDQGGPGGPSGPITGEGFREWSDRMRDVEELLDDPDLRAEAARIRDRVRGAREEFRRHAKEPDWTKLRDLVAEPIHELHDRVSEEVRRRTAPDSLVPIDRDPVPPEFAEDVRRYYERLGSGR